MRGADAPEPPERPAWPCAGGGPARRAAAHDTLAPPLDVAWTARLGAPPASEPVVSGDGMVYVGDREGRLHALDAGSGAKLFTLRTDPIREVSPAWPLVAGGLVPPDRVPVSGAPAVSRWHLLFGDGEGVFYCVRRGPGEVLWRKLASLPLASRQAGAYLAPLADDERVVALDVEGNLYAASARSGKTHYVRFLRGRPAAPPALAGAALVSALRPLFRGEAPAVAAIDVASGDRLWRADLPFEPGAALAADAERVFVGGAGGLLALGRARGEVAWHVPRPVDGPLAVGGGAVHAPCGSFVVAFDAAGGAVRWERAPAPALLPDRGPCLAGATLWVACEGGLLALDAAAGAPLGRVRLPAPPVGRPVAALGRLFVAGERGEVRALAPA